MNAFLGDGNPIYGIRNSLGENRIVLCQVEGRLMGNGAAEMVIGKTETVIHEWENSSFVVLETTSELSEGSNP